MENLDHIEQKDEEIRRILQEPLSGDDRWAQPGDHVWEGIDAALPDRKRRGGFWWWFGGAMLLLMGIFLIRPWLADPLKGTNEKVSDPLEASALSAIPDEGPEQNQSSEEAIIPGPASETSGPQLSVSSSESDLPHRHPTPVRNNSAQDIQAVHLAKPTSSDQEAIQEPTSAFELPIDVRTVEPVEPRADLSAPGGRSLDRTVPLLVLPWQELAITKDPLWSVLDQSVTAIDPLLVEVTTTPRVSIHRLMIYGQGLGADREIQRKTKNNLFDPEFGHDNSQIRFGAGYEWQHKSGFFIGTGLEYQDFKEEVVREKSWTYTKQNGTQVGSDKYQQNIPLVINSGFGTASTVLRVDINENNPTTDYQEGDIISFRMTMNHSLKWMRIPVTLGYHYAWRNWFAEVRGGLGMQLFLSSNAQITKLMDDRGKISLQESQATNPIKYVRSTILDTQAGLYAGYQWSDHWSVSCGYERWYSLQSVVDRPNVSTFTNGSGLQIALRRNF